MINYCLIRVNIFLRVGLSMWAFWNENGNMKYLSFICTYNVIFFLPLLFLFLQERIDYIIHLYLKRQLREVYSVST